jgi:hypothetical protein
MVSVGLALAAIAGLAVIWWLLPPVLYSDMGDENTRIKAISDTRNGFLAGLVGIGALATFWQNSRTYAIALRSLQLSEQGHVTDRLAKAVEQLGSASLEVRLGGIYALERIAVDSPRDHGTAVEVLSAFVRSRTDLELPSRDAAPLDAPVPSVDVQAVLSVLGRLPTRAGVSRGDLRRCNLRGADFRGTNLGAVKLTAAALDDADLREAHLEGADLRVASLQRCNFDGAHLQGAQLWFADLRGSRLWSAGLRSADLAGSKLQRAQLQNSDLRGASLVDALMYDAALDGALLEGADLSGALGLAHGTIDD